MPCPVACKCFAYFRHSSIVNLEPTPTPTVFVCVSLNSLLLSLMVVRGTIVPRTTVVCGTIVLSSPTIVPAGIVGDGIVIPGKTLYLFPSWPPLLSSPRSSINPFSTKITMLFCTLLLDITHCLARAPKPTVHSSDFQPRDSL